MDTDDPLDRTINKLKFHIMSFGFPDPENLRSSKKRDIRARIKCMAAMLKQRQKDIDYRHQVDPKMSRLQQDRDMFEDKYRKALSKINDLEKEKYSL